MEVTVNNPTRSRKWGFGYETQPERNSTRIIPPTVPNHTGTLNQVLAAIREDRAYQSFLSGGTFVNTRWFYDGKVIEGLAGSTYPGVMGAWLNDLGFAQENGRTYKSVTLILAD